MDNVESPAAAGANHAEDNASLGEDPFATLEDSSSGEDSSTLSDRIAEDSSSDSSEETWAASSSSSSKDWKIELATFTKTRIKLLTEINNSTKCAELFNAYFNNQHTALTKLPWEEQRPEYGIFPLHKFFYHLSAMQRK